MKSAPGFLVNRALLPYMLEAMVMYDEGIKPETIDKAAIDFGMPMGPIELADQVGLDICVHVADVLKESLGWPMPDAPQWLRDKVEKGDLGKKTGRGIYTWKNGEAVKAKDFPLPDEAMADRLILPMVNVCVALLREGVAETEDIIDGAMIFGTGFAPFRGGPLHYARQRGVAEVTKSLKASGQDAWQALSARRRLGSAQVTDSGFHSTFFVRRYRLRKSRRAVNDGGPSRLFTVATRQHPEDGTRQRTGTDAGTERD